MRRVTTVLVSLVGILLTGSDGAGASQQGQSKHTIVPGVRVGDYTVGMSKDDVLKKLGEPEAIGLGDEEYSLDDLPRRYVMAFGDLSFVIDYGSVEGICVRSPLYKLTNGLGVGDSEEKIKQAFGDDFQLKRFEAAEVIEYADKGILFEIRKKNRRVTEIDVNRPSGTSRVVRTLPKYDPDADNSSNVGLQGCDLSKLDLRNSTEILLHADFDDRTVWPAPDRMPSEFDGKKIMELGRNPG